jgi:hypothetical protein
MRIRAVHIRFFRSIANASLQECGPVNILIGKNNAGKSNLLTTIELALTHLRSGRIAGPTPWRRPQDEFTNRDPSARLRIGVEFELPTELNDGLRERLNKEAPHLQKSIDQIKTERTVSFILGAAVRPPHAFLFVEQVAVGRVVPRGVELNTDGIRLLSVSTDVASELYGKYLKARAQNADLEGVEEIRSGRASHMLEYAFGQAPEARTRFTREMFPAGLSADLRRDLHSRLATATNPTEFLGGLAQVAVELREAIEATTRSETDGVISAFAGDVRTQPAYAEWLFQQFGGLPFLHLAERKQPIGREEAETLLRLKVKRGGTERLYLLQSTIRSLLGVSVDAFEAEGRTERGGPSVAEMDVDDFLVDANGAGIREALRIILDLEVKQPRLVLIEEPEVHLHPGLARIVSGYLRQKSEDCQLFITTHSTEFVDSASFRNVYLVSRNERKETECELVGLSEGMVQIPAEIGLRLSTVFMYDRLVFVEGPSDQEVLAVFAVKAGVDLSRANVGFVYMGGIRNFGYFAAKATLDLLSHRRVRLWFVVDRDEQEDEEVERLMRRMGGQAKLMVLERREVENYLIDARALATFIGEKRALRGDGEVVTPSEEEVRRAIEEELAVLKEEVVRLRWERRMLKPIVLQTREVRGDVGERIEAAVKELQRRVTMAQTEKDAIAAELERNWGKDAIRYVPGSVLLERVARRFDVAFSPGKGDAERLARHISSLPLELSGLLREIGRA